jgi:hypothetical protein
MLIRHDVTSETYDPLPFSAAAYRRLGKADDGFAILRKAFRDHAPHLELDLGYIDTGAPFLVVTEPGAGLDDAPAVITRGEVKGPDGASKLGWQMHQGDDGPLYVFASEREVAEFLGSGMSRL